jgi:BirA family transcriptional regulator, biotin operon repressor / biotin---[acetyl-CoA-carboxylase] ligase
MSRAGMDIFAWTSSWLSAQGWPYQAFPLVTSTNDKAKEGAFSDPPHKVYIAIEQTAGRGRGTHVWHSPPPGQALLASWSFSLSEAPKQLTAPFMGLEVYRAAHQVWPHLPWSLRAPNDLYLGAKKVGGMLVETLTRGTQHRLVIGFGFNVGAAPDTVPEAGCLNDFLREPLREVVFEGFLQFLQKGLMNAAQMSSAISLSTDTRSELLSALQKHPLQQALRDVTPEGNLVYPEQSVPWQSL